MQDQTVEHRIARGREALARGNHLGALAEFQAAADAEPGFADVQNLRGLALALLGRPEEAVEAFDRALALNPRYVEAHLNRAVTLNDLGRLDEAREAFQRAADADEEAGGRFPAAVSAKLANAHADLGDLYLAAGAPEEALTQFRRAVSLRPRFLDIRNRLARTLIDLARPDDAADELRALLRANPSFAAARANLGLALFRAGRVAAAEAEWGRCLEQRPGDPQVSSYLGMLDRHRGGVPDDA